MSIPTKTIAPMMPAMIGPTASLDFPFGTEVSVGSRVAVGSRLAVGSRTAVDSGTVDEVRVGSGRVVDVVAQGTGILSSGSGRVRQTGGPVGLVMMTVVGILTISSVILRGRAGSSVVVAEAAG